MPGSRISFPLHRYALYPFTSDFGGCTALFVPTYRSCINHFLINSSSHTEHFRLVLRTSSVLLLPSSSSLHQHHSIMSPSAIHPETTAELVNHGIAHTIEKTARSLKPIPNGTSLHLPELDASKLIFIRNENPKSVPAFNCPEVWTSTP